MSDRAPYSRVYWSVLSDPKFVEVRQDMRLLGSWTVMLIVADMAWPAPAFVPPVVTRSALARLVESGLVDLDAGMFRIHGLDAERERRKAAATNGAPKAPQVGPKRDPDGEQAEPSRAETEPSQAQTPREDPAETYWSLTGRFPTGRALEWIDSLASDYGGAATSEALARAHISDRSSQTLLGRTKDILAADARKLSLRDREVEAARLAELRAKPRVEETWKTEFRAAIEEQYRRLPDPAGREAA